MRTALLSILYCAAILVEAQDPYTNVYSQGAWKARDSWQRAGAIIHQLGARPGSRVADIGCHEGYMTIKLAEQVGTTGTVYAVDLEQSRLDKLKIHLEEEKLSNVITIKGGFDDPHLPPGVLDGVIILDTYHEMKDHDKILLQIKASLKSSGRLVICEPIADERRKLSRAEQEKKHEVGLSFVLEDLKAAGFRILFKQDPFVDREKVKGDRMWIVVVEK